MTPLQLTVLLLLPPIVWLVWQGTLILLDLIAPLTRPNLLGEPFCRHTASVYTRVDEFGLVCGDCAEMLGARR